MIRSAIKFLFASYLLCNPCIAQSSRWVKVSNGSFYKGEQMYPPQYIDLNSVIKANDGLIVYRVSRFGATFPDYKKKKYHSASFGAINCEERKIANIQTIPKYRATLRDYSRESPAYNNEYPRNVEKAVCNLSRLRSVRHRTPQILYLNRRKSVNMTRDDWEGKDVITYDQAVKLGVLK